MIHDPLWVDPEFPEVLPSGVCQFQLAFNPPAFAGSADDDAPDGEAAAGEAPAGQASGGGAPAPAPDPRTPIQKLLERFDLEEDMEQRAQVAYWNQTELPENRRKQQEMEEYLDQRRVQLQGTPDPLLNSPDWQISDREASAMSQAAAQIEADARPPIAVDADADVHISESAIPFPRWHLDAGALATMKYPPNPDGTQPEEYRSPFLVSEPLRSIEEIDRAGPTTADPHTRIVDCIRLARSMIPEVPVKPKGKKGAAPAGTLGYVKYDARGTEGWMYVEDNQGEYGKWFQELILRKYKEAKILFEQRSAEPSASAEARLTARYDMRQAAACIAISNQEGAPSAINTYDGLVLSWGIGIAGPGKLPETFYHITKDPRVYKAFYLCGFRFEGTVIGDQYHGAYQIVDLAGKPPEDQPKEPAPAPSASKGAGPKAAGYKAPSPPPPAVVYRDQWKHDPKAKKYDFDGHAYRVLRYMTSQPKLIHLLIQLARDPLTRSVIFEPNYRMIQGFVAFVGGDHIHTDALHIFVSQVKHNWGLGPSIVGWAVSRFDDDERRLFLGKDAPPTSEDKDRAIAKGIVRYLMGRLQEQRWKRAVKMLEMEAEGKLKDPKASAKDRFLYQLPATTEFGFARLIEHYWKPLQKGPREQTRCAELGGAGLSVPGLLVETSESRKDGRYVWIEQPPKKGDETPPPKYYDLGPLSQFDLLFPHEEIFVLGLEGGQVAIEDRGTRRTVKRNLAPTRGGAG